MEKQVLFTTRDGVPIYLGDIFYFITVNHTPCYCDTIKDNWKEHDVGYNFSSEKICQDYINENFKK